MQKALLCFAVL